MRNIYKWSDAEITAAYNSVMRKKSKLSAAKRKAVVLVYRTKLRRGVLPVQKKMLKISNEIIYNLIEKCLLNYLRNELFTEKCAKYALSKITLISNESGFNVLLTGVLIGDVSINYKNGTHSASFKPNN